MTLSCSFFLTFQYRGTATFINDAIRFSSSITSTFGLCAGINLSVRILKSLSTYTFFSLLRAQCDVLNGVLLLSIVQC